VITVNYGWMGDASTLHAVGKYACPVLTSMESDRQAPWVSDNPSALGRVFQVGSVWSQYGKL
jgi:hypothetical protein